MSSGMTKKNKTDDTWEQVKENNWRAGGTLIFIFFFPIRMHVGGIDGNSREMVSTADDSVYIIMRTCDAAPLPFHGPFLIRNEARRFCCLSSDDYSCSCSRAYLPDY